MLCEKCNKNNATLYVNEYKDGKVTESYLCNDCAKVQNPISDFTQSAFQNFLTGLLEMTMGNTSYNISTKQSDIKELKCPNCKMTDEEFRKIGRFGCNICYETFSDILENALKKIQPSNQHVGKVPERLAHIINTKREMESLKEELKEAIRQEEFEKAAQLRDRIRILEKGGEGGE